MLHLYFINFFGTRKKNKYYLNIPILIIIVDAFLSEGLFYHYLGNNTEINLTPMSFALGSLFAVNSEKINVDLKVVFITVFVYFIFKNTQQNHVLLIICAATIITYVSSNKQFIKLKPKYDISYGVYLWGFLIQQTIYYYLGHLYTGVHCLIAIFFSVLFGILSYVLIEKPFIL